MRAEKFEMNFQLKLQDPMKDQTTFIDEGGS